MKSTVILEQLGGAIILTLKNGVSNTLSLTLLEELMQVLNHLRSRSDVRAITITGASDYYFSDGLDLTWLQNADASQVEDFYSLLNQVIEEIRNLEVVTVAAVNGKARGVGVSLALACDYIVVENGANFAFPEAKQGILPTANATGALIRRVGLPWAKRMMLGGETVSAEKALQIGLAEEVVESGFSKIIGVSLANKLEQQAPNAIRLTKTLLKSVALDQDSREQEKNMLVSIWGTDEQKEGIEAYLGNRRPYWDRMD